MAAPQASKVLLLEDDATMQAVLRTFLEIEGYQVVIAPVLKGQEDLVAFIRRQKPDVMLLDVHLRNSNGIEILRELRQDTAFAATRIILTSGSDVGEKCLAAGASSFLMKPYMPDELINKLRG
jgi:DNA-binding response OmpR family regulator